MQAGKIDLTEVLTVSPHAAQQPNSRLGLRTGQTITVEQAILAVTTRSANDAAVLLAERLGRTEQHFAEMMTQQAAQLGMYSTTFENASGLPGEGQVSSARDLAILSHALIRDYPQYYPYFSQTEFVYKGRVLPNTNRILRSYPDGDGMKTGFTCGSGYNLIASAKRNGHRLIGVLLGAHSSAERFNQMTNLLDLGFENFYQTQNNGLVSQLKFDNVTPPPFQLSSNRCAGSALQMGADAGGSSRRYQPIQIKPEKKSSEIKPVINKQANNAAEKNPVELEAMYSVSLGQFVSKQQAQHAISQAQAKLQDLAKLGLPSVVKAKAKQGWHLVWAQLPETPAKAYCNRLQNLKLTCSVHAVKKPSSHPNTVMAKNSVSKHRIHHRHQ